MDTLELQHLHELHLSLNVPRYKSHTSLQDIYPERATAISAHSAWLVWPQWCGRLTNKCFDIISGELSTIIDLATAQAISHCTVHFGRYCLCRRCAPPLVCLVDDGHVTGRPAACCALQRKRHSGHQAAQRQSRTFGLWQPQLSDESAIPAACYHHAAPHNPLTELWPCLLP